MPPAATATARPGLTARRRSRRGTGRSSTCRRRAGPGPTRRRPGRRRWRPGPGRSAGPVGSCSTSGRLVRAARWAGAGRTTAGHERRGAPGHGPAPSPTFRAVASPRSTVSRWRDLPTAAWMLAPSLVILVDVRALPARAGGVAGSDALRRPGRQLHVERLGPVRRRRPQRRVPPRRLGDGEVRPAHRAASAWPLGVGLAVLADKYLRGLAVFRFIFSSTIATGVAVASLMWLFLLQPDIGVLANVEWIADLFPVVKAPGLLRDPGTALGVGGGDEHLGRDSGSRSCSSRPGCRASPATSTRRPSSTAPVASGGSGASPCRCSARRCCSCSSC